MMCSSCAFVVHSLPFFSVVIPTHNRPRLLAACVRSVLAQEYAHERYEILVVDDGGRRGAARRALAPFLDTGRARYLWQKRGGWGQARRLGARECQGDTLVFIDDDCVAPPGWLACYARAFAARPEATGIGGGLRPGTRMNVAGRKQYLGHLARFDRLNEPMGAHVGQAGWVWFTFGGNRAFRREAWLEAQRGNSASWYYDDYIVDLRLREMGARVYYDPAAWVAHHYVLSVGQRMRAAFRYGRSERDVGAPVVEGERAGRVPATLADRWRQLRADAPDSSLGARAWYTVTQPLVWLARRAGHVRGSGRPVVRQ
jgi:glycosyltransferase involved in cell wall biosynthesis